MEPRGYVVAPEDAPAFWQLGNLWRVLASGIKTNNRFCLIDQLQAPDGGPGAHAHPADEGLFVVSGHCTFSAGGATMSAGPGTFVCVPRHTQHAFTVDEAGTRLLNFYLPAGFEVFVMAFAHPAERNELPPPGIALPPRRLVEQLSRDYGQIAIARLSGADKAGPNDKATEPTPGARVPPYSRCAADAPAFWAARGLWSKLADGVSTDGSYCLFEVLMPIGRAAPPHVHLGADEVVFVLDGALEVFLGTRTEVVGTGGLVFVPRGTAHTFSIVGDTTRLLILHTPSGFERIVEDLGEPAGNRALPPADWQEPEVAEDFRERLYADLGLECMAAPR